MPVSRRSFLQRVAAAGGYGAAYSAMVAMGLMATPAVAAAAAQLPANLGLGKRVVILGGGIAGLVNAYELERAGFKVTLLGARGRLGGRNWTRLAGGRDRLGPQDDRTSG